MDWFRLKEAELLMPIDSYPKAKRLPALTSLRAFFAVWVLLRHWFFVYSSGAFFPLGDTWHLVDVGYLGVDGFFVLSGFILSHNYYLKFASGSFSYKDFLVARFARIYPVHFCCLLMAAFSIVAKAYFSAANTLGSPGNTIVDLLKHFFLVNAWSITGRSTGWNDVDWSVSAEVFAYFTFPVAIFLASSTRRWYFELLALICCVAALWLVQRVLGNGSLSIDGSVARIIPEFMLGVILNSASSRVAFRPRGLGFFAIALLIFAVTVAGSDLIAVCALALLIFAVSDEDDLLARAISIGPLIFLGEISYSLYLVQRMPQGLLGALRERVLWLQELSVVIQVVLLAGCSLGAAVVLHKLVEAPFARYIKRLTAGAGAPSKPVRA